MLYHTILCINLPIIETDINNKMVNTANILKTSTIHILIHTNSSHCKLCYTFILFCSNNIYPHIYIDKMLINIILSFSMVSSVILSLWLIYLVDLSGRFLFISEWGLREAVEAPLSLSWKNCVRAIGKERGEIGGEKGEIKGERNMICDTSW